MFTLPDLPYRYNALSPTISEKTLHFHHDKHHASYVKTLNTLLEEARAAPESLEDVIRANAKGGSQKIFNNAAQAWNHAFFWQVMTPKRGRPEGDIAAAINEAFGSVKSLHEAFVKAGAEHFGSGWVWLVAQAGEKLEVITTHDAQDTVSDASVTPLLVCDLWEHAYYLDYQNDRKGFLEAWFDTVANWPFAASQLTAAGSGAGGWRYPAPSRTARAA